MGKTPKFKEKPKSAKEHGWEYICQNSVIQKGQSELKKSPNAQVRNGQIFERKNTLN